MCTRIGVITDAHANLPATQAVLAAMDTAGCDLIVHLGDVIGIGPHPREVLEIFLHRDDMVLIMGNHDELFAFDQLRNPPAWITPGELEHQRWTHAQLPNAWRRHVAQWPYTYDLAIGETTIRFQHYAINDHEFAPISRSSAPSELDVAFQPTTDIVFHGHHHPRADVRGKARYINSGALGTNPAEGARYALIDELKDGTISVSFDSVSYDAARVRTDLLEREVPEADFILRTFLSDWGFVPSYGQALSSVQWNTAPSTVSEGNPMANLKFDAICIDCSNPERLARFYGDLLRVETHGDHLFTHNGELKIWFQPVEDYQRPTWPTQERGQQIHFDIHTHERETEVVRAVAMGASIADDDAEDFTVMLDPEGHPFCICDASNATWGSGVKT